MSNDRITEAQLDRLEEKLDIYAGKSFNNLQRWGLLAGALRAIRQLRADLAAERKEHG